MYYRLQEHCKLVKGAERGAIYDLHSGKVHSINQGACELITACQQECIDDVLEVDCAENAQYVEFLDQLTEKGIGALFFSAAAPRQEVAPRAEIKLEFLWLELTSNCNNRCLHCYAGSGETVTLDPVSHECWLRIISEGKAAGATAIQLIGGEPLLYPLWRELIVKAHEAGYSYIEIFTNGTLIDESDIEFFKQYNVNIATTIYANNAETHDTVTQNPGSFENTMANIRKLLAAQIPLRIASIIMKANEHEVQNIMNLYAELGVEVAYPDVIRPTGRGENKELLPESYHKQPVKPPFRTDAQAFAIAQQAHNCLAGKIAITADGDVIPCIFARKQVCGNILQTSLAEIINGPKLQQCWHVTKDIIKKCKDCEYRYACTDCRPLAQGQDVDGDWLACTAGCSYNPYTGKWEDGAVK